jgi:outer membrane receptor for ferrienterochelin and colicins
MKNFVKTAMLMAFLISAQLVVAQQISGTVLGKSKEGAKPLPGVNIYWKGTQSGTVSDENGNFSLQVSSHTHDLIFSFIGYVNDTMHTHPGDVLVIELRESLDLDEVEVVTRANTAFVSRMSTVNATTITSGELMRAACCNLSESFETSASVDVSYSDAVTGAKQIEMLGLAGIYTQMMSENIPNLRGLATSFGLSYVPGSWMESIQVSKGTSSVLNGYESISGQINVEYKKPQNSERFF